MRQLILGKLALLLTLSFFTSSLPTFASVACSKNSYKQANHYYGDDGRDGRSGREGRSGRPGQNQTVFADGSPMNLDLSGGNGDDGEDGERGYRPNCREQHDYPHRDINAADGGDGGNGGRGGDAGNGGLLTVYYNNLEDLKKIYVRASGGEGGRGGRGASGADGCRCRRHSWQIETCTGTPGSSDHKCTKKTYRCYDGDDGRDGSDGRDGKRGNLGSLSIVKGKETLASDNPKTTLAISELGNKQINLSKNKWNLRNGAGSLLAPGSIIADEYHEFDRRLEGIFQLVWQDKQPISRYGSQNATLTLNDNNQIEIAFAENLWVEGSSTTEANLTKYVVNTAIPKQDVTRLAVSDFADSGQNLNLKIVDLAARSDVINTKFQIKYRVQDGNDFRGFSDYQKVYEGEIPPELVTRDFNRFTLALGKLPIASTALRPGVKVDIEVQVIRSLGTRYAKQTINWQGNVRR